MLPKASSAASSTRSAPTPGGGGSRDIDAAVRQVIGDAVDAGEVIDLFAAAGLDAARLDILSEDFLNRVSALEQKNLALETLRKLLTDQIKISERTNLVQAQKFREALEKAMLGYSSPRSSSSSFSISISHNSPEDLRTFTMRSLS